MTPQQQAEIVFGGLSKAERSFFPRAHFDLTISMGPTGINTVLEKIPVTEWRDTLYGLWLSQWNPKGGMQ